MNIYDELNERKFIYLKSLISKEKSDELSNYLRNAAIDGGVYDDLCPKSKSLKFDPIFDQLLLDVLPDIESATGKKLLPSYSYARHYVPDEELKIHIDRPACEYSVTLTLGYEGRPWPIYMGVACSKETENVRIDYDNNNIYLEKDYKIDIDVSDAVLYKGCELHHWREKYKEGKWQTQVFLHYVDADGPHKNHAYEYTKKLKPKENNIQQIDDLTFWVYDDVLTVMDCDAIIKTYNEFEGEIAKVGIEGDGVDEKIRKVNKLELPIYKGIGAILTAVGIDANKQRWKFDVTGPNQCELLRYPANGGRYKGHIDTFLSNREEHLQECRKLTVLAFLNDDFNGGKFFLQVGPDRFYPPQKKGTVLVFPSFLYHGVEDVEEGERYSIVTWLVGPWFK